LFQLLCNYQRRSGGSLVDYVLIDMFNTSPYLTVLVFSCLFIFNKYIKVANGQPLAESSQVWAVLAERALRTEQLLAGPINNNDLKVATEGIYANYLRYINDLGLTLSKENFKSKLEETKERLPVLQEYCTTAQLNEWESYSMSALDSGISLFVDTYCGIPCRNEHTLWTTAMDPTSCVDEATALYQAYDCSADPRLAFSTTRFLANFSGAIPSATSFARDDLTIDSFAGKNGDLSEGIHLGPDGLDVVDSIPANPPDLEFIPFPEGDLSFGSINRGPQMPLHLGNTLPTSSFPPRSVKEKVSQKVAKCQKAANMALISTFAPNDDLVKINDHFDPAWISTTESPAPEGAILKDIVDGSRCMISEGDGSSGRLQKLHMAYEKSRDQQFLHYFGNYHIWDLSVFENENDNDDNNDSVDFGYDEAMVKQIKSSADRFFLDIINSYDPLFGIRPCVDVPDEWENTGFPIISKSPEVEDPKKIITFDDLTATDNPFKAFNRFLGSFFDSFTWTDSLGTGDEAHPPLWDNMLKDQISGPELAAYVDNLKARSPEGYAAFIRFLELNEQHLLIEFLADVAGGFASHGIVSASKWTAAKSLSVLSKVEFGIYSSISSSYIQTKLGGLFGGKMANIVIFWKAGTSITFGVSELTFRDAGRLTSHFSDHGKEWATDVIRNEAEYLARAQAFVKSASHDNMITHVSRGGYFYKYDQPLNEFAIVTPAGFIMTYYRPKGTPKEALESIIAIIRGRL